MQAAAVANSLFCMCYKFNLQVQNATVLLLLAEIHKVLELKFCKANFFSIYHLHYLLMTFAIVSVENLTSAN